MSQQIAIPLGRHDATVAAVRLTQSGLGTPQVDILLSTPHGQGVHTLYFSEKAGHDSMDRLVETFGFNGDFAALDHQLVGKQCSITVQEEFDDKGTSKGNRIRWINPYRPMLSPEALAKDLTAKFGSFAQATTLPQGGKTFAPKGTFDEIPMSYPPRQTPPPPPPPAAQRQTPPPPPPPRRPAPPAPPVQDEELPPPLPTWPS